MSSNILPQAKAKEIITRLQGHQAAEVRFLKELYGLEAHEAVSRSLSGPGILDEASGAVLGGSAPGKSDDKSLLSEARQKAWLQGLIDPEWDIAWTQEQLDSLALEGISQLESIFTDLNERLKEADRNKRLERPVSSWWSLGFRLHWARGLLSKKVEMNEDALHRAEVGRVVEEEVPGGPTSKTASEYSKDIDQGAEEFDRQRSGPGPSDDSGSHESELGLH